MDLGEVPMGAKQFAFRFPEPERPGAGRRASASNSAPRAATGRFWAERWHGRDLDSPRQVRNALVSELQSHEAGA
jgi:hypothetical protein